MFLVLLASSAPVLAQHPAASPGDGAELPDLTITAIKPYHYRWSDEYGLAMGDPFFNLRNYVNVTVQNNGTTTAEVCKMALYADGDLIGSETIEDLGAGQARELKFPWTPEGEDPLSWTDTAQGAKLSYRNTSRIYTLSAVVDEDEAVQELNETNNELTREQKVVWNGFAADQPLEEYAHDLLRGGMIITTGDAVYRSDKSRDSGTVYGSPYKINYNVQIPGSTKLARLYLYYTWAEPKSSRPKAPKIQLTMQTPGGTSTELRLDASYNDLKGDFLNFRFHAWGTYAYDLTNYVRANGTYVVTVENINDGSDDDFTDEYSFAAPALLVVYEDNTAPLREYWITEGADILMGGRRSDGGFLGLDSCRNSARFTGEHLDQEVEKAVLGVITPWADDAEDDLIEFNGRELGKGLYNGYFHAWRADLEGLSMEVGANEAQQGVVAIDVTRYLEPKNNEVVQGDDGDNMMPATAVLVVTYKEVAEEDGSGGSGGSSAKESAATTTSTIPSTAPATAVTKATRIIPRLDPGKEVAMVFQDMDVSLLALTAASSVSDAKVVVERVEKPFGIPDPSGIPYVFFQISVDHDEDASIAGRIEFKVATSWIAENRVAAEAVTLNRYHEREGWSALPTANIAEMENATVYFEAVTPGFSLFAVTAGPVTTLASPATPKPTPVPTPVATLPAPTVVVPATEQSTEPASTEAPGFECVVVLLMLVCGAFLFFRTRGIS